MAFSFNRVELIGRLGHDPELRYTAGGQTVARFSLATNRPAPAGTTPETDWHQVVAWHRLGEFAAEFLAKGRLVFVADRLTYHTWEGNDGLRRRGAEIVAVALIPLDHRPIDHQPVDHPSGSIGVAAGSDPATEDDRDVAP